MGQSPIQLSTLAMKKLLCEFLKLMLPSEVPADLKTHLHSVQYYLKKYPAVGCILTLLMRWILWSRYQVMGALDFE